MKRRRFITNSALLSAASLFPGMVNASIKFGQLENLGIQLFSLPKLLEKDFRKAIQMLAEMGYRKLELFGPYTFSAESVKKSWNAITPMLGFSGSGYFGHTAAEVKLILRDNNIEATSAHTDMDTLEHHMGALGDAANEMGFKYVGLPAIPEERRKTLDDYKKIVDSFNKIGENAKKEGLKFAYHNHGYGLQETNGQIPLNMIIEQTDPNLVCLEMDIYWTTAGGGNPVDYLKSYPGRYELMHLKDMKEKVRFSGDGGSPPEWIELFPYMASAGQGILDLETIISTGIETGVKHFFVEQDMVAKPEEALKISIDYLKSI